MRPLLLVVEDDAATRTLLTVVLTRAGFEVDSVANASDALTLLSVVPYAAITLDLYLRGTSGHDVLIALAATPDLLRRIVVVSAAPAAEVNELRRLYGITVVRKPFDLSELVTIAKQVAAPAPPRNLAAEFCRRSICLGAKAGIVFTATPDDGVFHLAANYGYPRGAIDEFLPIEVGAPYPICTTYRSKRDIWMPAINSGPERPQLSGIWRTAEAQALATLPLSSGERTIGAVGWVFREERPFCDADRMRFGAIADYLARSLIV